MKCRYCGSTINSDSRFCQYCGHTVIQNENLAKMMEPTEVVEEPQEELPEEKPQKEEYKKEKRREERYHNEHHDDYHNDRHNDYHNDRYNDYHRPEQRKKKRFSKQHIRSLIMLSLAIVAIICGILLPFITPEKSKSIIDAMWTNSFWKVLNIIMLTIPQGFITLLGQMGWLFILFICLAGIAISLLTMIRTTRTKKMISLGIISAYVVILIITLIIFETKVK